MLCVCISSGVEKFPDSFLSWVPPHHLHDDGCVVLYVLQVKNSAVLWAILGVDLPRPWLNQSVKSTYQLQPNIAG